MRYSEGFKRSVVRRMITPGGPSANQVSEETGVSLQTVYKWLRDLKDSVQMSDHNRAPDEWTLPEKNTAIMEIAELSPDEQGEWLRKKGLHSGLLVLR